MRYHELLQFELYVTPLFVSLKFPEKFPEDQQSTEIMDGLLEKIGNQYDSRVEADKLIWEKTT